MHHLLHLQILPKQKEKTQSASNLTLCLFEPLSVQHMFVRKHNGCILVPYLPNNDPFCLFFFANSWDKCLFSTGYSITYKLQCGKSLDNSAVHTV